MYIYQILSPYFVSKFVSGPEFRQLRITIRQYARIKVIEGIINSIWVLRIMLNIMSFVRSRHSPLQYGPFLPLKITLLTWVNKICECFQQNYSSSGKWVLMTNGYSYIKIQLPIMASPYRSGRGWWLKQTRIIEPVSTIFKEMIKSVLNYFCF